MNTHSHYLEFGVGEEASETFPLTHLMRRSVLILHISPPRVEDFIVGNDTRVVEGKRGREGSVHADLEEKIDREEVDETDAIEEKRRETRICLRKCRVWGF